MTKSLKPSVQLSDLEAILRSLLMAFEQGEWDKISDFSEQLLPALEAARMADSLTTNAPQHPEQIKHTLSLLQSAIEKCTERKEQITPLINALIPAKDVLENP